MEKCKPSESLCPHPMDAVVSVLGVEAVADLLGQALERFLDSPGGEEKFIAYLERTMKEPKS